MQEKSSNTKLPENIAKNLVFIDGICRCGKSAFSSIIPSFESFEHLQISNILENMVPAVMLGGVEKDSAKMMIRLELNELSYNLQLSRNVNFRKSDQTGIANYREPKIYFDRLEALEGNNVVNSIRTNANSIPFQTHNMMVNLDIVNSLDLDYKILEIYRNPIDNIYSCWARGWGERFSHDPRSFTLRTSYNESLYPWFCFGIEEKIINLNQYERCVIMFTNLLNSCIEKQKEASNPEKIITIFFEDMFKSPDYEISKIGAFLGKSITNYTAKFIEDARFPRELDLIKRKEKLSILKKNVAPEIFDLLISMAEYYESEGYGLR